MSGRRTFLGNSAAALVMTKISSLKPFGFGTEGRETIDPTVSDREKAGLRGPVKTCVEERTDLSDANKYSTTTEYSPDGRLLTSRSTNSDGSEWVSTQTYDANGRLEKTVSGKVGEPGDESLYSYDETGRPLTITSHPEKGGRIDFRYDEQGRKTTIQSFSPETLNRARSTSYGGGSLWDASVVAGVGVPIGGNITTIYSDKDLPTEAQLRDGQGRIVTRIVRSYDANGRIIEEKQIQENPMLMFANQFGTEGQPQLAQPQPTAAQLEAINNAMKLMLSGPNGTGTSYSYDAQGRETERRERNSWFAKVTTTSYNERGGKIAELESMTQNAIGPTSGGFSMDESGTIVWDNPAAEPTEFPDEFFGETKVSYAYQYDGHGNWTQQTVDHKSSFGEASSISRRMLTYY
jgi:YD repeat-containing protein